MWEHDQNQQHPGQFSKFSQPTQSGAAGMDLMATETAWRLWQVMGEVYSNRWTQKNGAEPSPICKRRLSTVWSRIQDPVT